MSEMPEQILDYASPMAKTPLRLAVRSIIRMYAEPDGVSVYETLTGQGQALGAIIFSGCTVALLGSALYQTERPRAFADYFLDAWFVLYFLTVFATVALIFAVIHQNWRKTILRASAEQLTLVMESPFKSVVRRWPGADVRFVHVVQSLDPRTQRLVYHLQIEMSSGQRLQLFGGHEMAELAEIANAVRKCYPVEGAELPGTGAARTPQTGHCG
jgi:hypothetical protein